MKIPKLMQRGDTYQIVKTAQKKMDLFDRNNALFECIKVLMQQTDNVEYKGYNLLIERCHLT